MLHRQNFISTIYTMPSFAGNATWFFSYPIFLRPAPVFLNPQNHSSHSRQMPILAYSVHNHNKNVQLDHQYQYEILRHTPMLKHASLQHITSLISTCHRPLKCWLSGWPTKK